MWYGSRKSGCEKSMLPSGILTLGLVPLRRPSRVSRPESVTSYAEGISRALSPAYTRVVSLSHRGKSATRPPLVSWRHPGITSCGARISRTSESRQCSHAVWNDIPNAFRDVRVRMKGSGVFAPLSTNSRMLPGPCVRDR